MPPRDPDLRLQDIAEAIDRIFDRRLTAGGHRVTMSPVFADRLFRRLTAIVLLMMLAPVTYASAACAGWSGSAAERMACCQRADDGCESMSADECCADGEQRQNQETVAAVPVTPGVAQSQPVPPLPRPPQSFVLNPRSLAQRPDTYLLDSVFLI